MPILNLALTPDGAIVELLVGVSEPRRQVLQSGGQPVPSPVSIHALIDIGASCSCVDASVIQLLGMPPKANVPIASPTTGATPATAFEYDVSLTIVHPLLGKFFGTVAIVES